MWIAEAIKEAADHASRTLLGSLGVALAVAMVVVTINLDRSGALAALEVVDRSTPTGIPVVSAGGILAREAVLGVSGVIEAGAVQLREQPSNVEVESGPVIVSHRTLPVAEIEAAALRALDVEIMTGPEPVSLPSPVAILTANAFEALGRPNMISTSLRVDGVPFPIGSIVRLPLAEGELASAVLILGDAEWFSSRSTTEGRTLYLRVDPALTYSLAAQLPLILDPNAPESISVLIPPRPVTTRELLQLSLSNAQVATSVAIFSIAGILISTLVWTSVAQKTPQIGLQRALGASRRDVFFLTLTEAIMVGLIGAMLGAAVAVVASIGLSLQAGQPIVIELSGIGIATGLALLVGALAGVPPASRASRVSPAAAMRSL